jgi:hypothetical protein
MRRPPNPSRTGNIHHGASALVSQAGHRGGGAARHPGRHGVIFNSFTKNNGYKPNIVDDDLDTLLALREAARKEVKKRGE